MPAIVVFAKDIFTSGINARNFKCSAKNQVNHLIATDILKIMLGLNIATFGRAVVLLQQRRYMVLFLLMAVLRAGYLLR